MAEQVRIDLTADDQASKKIDKVADGAEQLEKLDPEVTVTADDDATPTLDKVTDAAEQLGKLDPEVTVTADDRATPDLRAIGDEAAALSRADTELVLKARIDDARGQLKLLRDDLEQTADKAQQTERRMDDIGRSRGPGLAGNAVSDMTGPLGEASSAASDIAGVFDGLGDVAGAAAARVGLDAEKMAGAITGIGFAITAAAAVWTIYRQKQAAAREKQAELVKGQREFNRAIAEGDRAAAAAKFAELYEDALDAAARFGVNAETATRFIRGQTTALPELDAEIRRVSDAIDENGGKINAANNTQLAYLETLTGTRDQLEENRDSYKQANGTLAEQDRRLSDVSRALGGAARDAERFATSQDRIDAATESVNSQLDAMRGKLDMDQALLDWQEAFARAVNNNGETVAQSQADVIAMKQAIIDAGEAVGKSPWQIQTELDAVDAGELQTVKTDVENWYRQYPVIVASKLDLPVQQNSGGGRVSGAPQMLPPADSGTIGTVNLTLPAGWRGDPLREAHRQRRRAGRYYSRLG